MKSRLNYREPASQSSPLGFALFLALNAVLLIRPQEWIPGLQIPFYEILIIGSVLTCFRGLARQLDTRSLGAAPVSVCVLGMFAAIVMSHVAHLWAAGAYASGMPFLKILLYYFLLLVTVDTPKRLRTTMCGFVLSLGVVTLLAILQYSELIDMPGWAVIEDRRFDSETGTATIHRRMVGAGIFNDPNDLALILVVGMAAGLYLLLTPGQGIVRIFWLALLGLFGFGLTLTYSRGGFIALLAGVAVLFQARFGWRKAVSLVAVIFPMLLALFGGRQTDISGSLESDTGQGRIQIWQEGLELFRREPLVGIGADKYAERVTHVAHNSFLQCYTELGLFGGTFFLGAFCSAALSLMRLGRQPWRTSPEVIRLRPYVMAMVGAYAAGNLSLSRSYVLPTYLVLGMAAAYIRIAAGRNPVLRFDRYLVAGLGLATAVVLLILHVVVRLSVTQGLDL